MIAQLEEVTKVWPSIREILAVPHNEQEYSRVIRVLDELVDEVGEDEAHPLASLLETLGSLVESYEEREVPEPKGDPLSALHMLMDQHGLEESDLPEVGDGEEISAILAGRKPLARTSHQLSAARVEIPVSASLRSLGLLDVSQRIRLRGPRSQASRPQPSRPSRDETR